MRKQKNQSIIHNRAFILLWLGQTVSRLGNLVYDVALGYTVYLITGSPLSVGTVLSCFTFAQLLTLVFGGAVVDRFSRKNIILITDIIAGLVTMLLVVALMVEQLSIEMMYLISIVLGIVSAFHLPAYRAIIPEALHEHDITAANGLNSITNSITRVIGPSIGAGLLTWLGAMGAFLFNALSFWIAVVAMIFTPIRVTQTRRKDQEKKLLSDVMNGLRIAFQTPWLRDLFIISSAINVLVLGPITILIPVIVGMEELSPAIIGGVMAMQGIGTVLSNSAILRIPSRKISMKFIFSLSISFGLGALLIGLSQPLYLFVLGGFFVGLGACTFTLKQTLIQTRVSSDYHGRIFSLDMSASFVLLPLGYATASILADLWSPRLVIIVGGSIEIFLSGLFIFLEKGRVG